ncbi:MAG TPA: hypothetical protein VFU90_16205, partial [Candidatus Tumulicola sp.]|nr:hypothetical protein [Candidatus Tumulicola sp.]
MQRKFEFTLSRWHRIAERVRVAAQECEKVARNAFTATTISPWNKVGVEDKAAEIARRGSEALALSEAGYAAVAHIRAALALRNAQLGVSAKLSEVEAAKQLAVLYKAIVDGQTADMVRPEAVRELPSVVGESESYGFGRRPAQTVTLQTADATLVASLRNKLEREQLRATRLLDELADLNRDQLEIELPSDVLMIAG